MISRIKNSSVAKLAGVTMLGVIGLAACGGGGGDPGASNSAAAANRFTLSLLTRPTTSVFFGGSNTTAYVSLVKSCTTNCGNVPLDNVAGQVVTLTSSDPSAVTFSPSTAVTDSEGNAQIVISSASRNVSGLIQLTASATLSGTTYSRNAALRVNAEVDRTISQADDTFFQVLDKTKDCSNYETLVINVKNPAGVIQNNSTVTLASISTETDSTGAVIPLAEAGFKDLGLFSNLGRVWLLQIRPPELTCLATGSTAKIGDVTFRVSPGDGSPAYSIGYKIKFNSK
jgi:hypothetical protein